MVDAAAFASIGYTPYVYYTGFAGNYTAVESGHDGWVQTGLIVDGQAKAVNATAQVHVNYTSGETHTVTYGNFQCYLVTGSKVNDTNGNGVADSGEGTIAGWTIQLYRNGNLYATTTTGSDGKYTFGPLCQGGSFVVKEVNKDGWTQTGNKDYSFTAKSGVSRTNLVFTNHKNDTRSSPSCLLLCLHLQPPTSVNLDANLNFNAAAAVDAGAFALDCTDLVAAVRTTVSADVDATVDTDAGCGCNPNETDAALAVAVDTAVDTTASANASGNSSPPPCTSACGTSPPPCSSACDSGPSTATDVSADASADVAADVAADVVGGACGCDTADVGADLAADASAAVGADVVLT